MIPSEQETLFRHLRETHASWSPRFASGFVHGAKDEGDRKNPAPQFVEQAGIVADGQGDDYARAYLLGFATYRGADAVGESWYNVIADLVRRDS